MAVDVTCVHPLRPSEGRPTPENVRKALVAEETNKRNKYNQSCAEVGWRFQPLAIHPFAGCTSDGAQFLHRLGRFYAESATARHTKAERVSLFWSTFSITVIREVTAQLRLTTYTGPQGPVLQYLWPTDDGGNEIRPEDHGRPKRLRMESTRHQPYGARATSSSASPSSSTS